MKIALVRQRYTPFGGAERFVARAMEALENEGTQLTVVARKWQNSGNTPSLTCNPFYLGNLWRDWSFARCVCRTLEQQRFDLVQSHERIACCDIYRAGDGVHREWLKQRRRILSFSSSLGIALNPFHRYVLAAEKRLFASPRLKAVICNSAMVKNEIMEYFGVPAEKLHVIYSGVDTAAFHPRLKEQHRAGIRRQYAIPDNAPLFLFVGSGFERKGLAAVLRALEIVSDAHLLIVGTDKKLRAYQRLAKSAGLSQRTYFVGGQQDTAPFYGAADAFVLPTLYDPFPNAALEAMAAGLPVITSTKSGAAELIADGRNGFVCDALDIPALARCMTTLTQSATAKNMGEAARVTVEPYTLESMSSALVSLYQQLLARRSMI
jgi:UDP-glucose:(heptosyl)LPS alpha-1,3-glucosyltransferase